ncbi:MAG: GT4 family glycosyltransferase PelF [candidate division KSB1 bacterium]|nr:GT4 family glycosyltransferase PelF [candidate division KSB1 bacterium]MDZ7302451.1 GT4 family glycosyltransferase PelF [candidate division KSB1 bacterium]MDZ7311955.1 GT4 family glycosyltransferase PelF [candidate division KSB1 bacterium]
MKRASPGKIKVAHVCAHLQYGGKENGVVNLVNSLNPDIFENYIFTYVHGGPLIQRVDPTRCRVIELGDKLGGDYRLYFKLAREFWRYRIHIAHTHSWATLLEGVVGAKLAAVPIIIHGEHGTMKTDTKVHIYVQRLFWHTTDQVLSVSEVLRENLHKNFGFPQARIRVIANGVDLGRFEVSPNGVDYKARLGLPSEALVIGAVGRLVPVKAYPILLKASKLVFREIPNAYLMVVGEGPLYEELKKMANDYDMADHVRFLGGRKDVPEILRALDVFVLASESEGMSNTILEAMASGLPVVATAVGGNPELVVHGETGLLVPPNHPNAMAAAILKLLRDPEQRQQMGRLGHQRIVEKFSLEAMVRNYAKIYIELFTRRFKLSESMQAKLRAQALL